MFRGFAEDRARARALSAVRELVHPETTTEVRFGKAPGASASSAAARPADRGSARRRR